jgi:type I restriction enzyme S subunit
MAGEFPTAKVGDLAMSISDTHKMKEERLIFLNTSDILLGKILHRTYTPVKDWPGQAKKSIRRNDILFSEIRPANGRWVYVNEAADDFVVSTKLMVIRSKTEEILPKYLYQFLTSKETSGWLQHLAESRSGTFPQITFDQIAALDIPLPPLPEQRAIAHIIGTIDDLIELNREANELLEEMARALFKSWFVDFDPVRAKLEGRPPAGMDAATAALFPDHFQDSELGQIPKGWEVGRMSDIVSLGRVAVNPGKYPTEVFDHYSLPAFDVGRSPKSEIGSTIMSNKFLVEPDAVLLSKLNPHIPRVWLPDLNAERRSVCSTEFMVARAIAGASREYLFSLFTNPSFANVYGTLVSGTTGSHQRIGPDSFIAMQIVAPPVSVIKAFTDSVCPIFDTIHSNLRESRDLATLRDTLLPKLLSGEITVPVAE